MSDLLRFIFTTQESFQNPKRVESLYDDLNRLKEFEPAGYRANIDVWRHALLAASKEAVLPTESGKPSKSRFVMSTGDQLLKALETRQFGLPQSLGLVLEDAVQRRDIIPLAEFQHTQTSIYRRGWMPSLPSLGDILIWSWKQLGFGAQGYARHSLPKADWVVPENLEEASSEFLAALKSPTVTPTSTVHTLSTLRSTLPVSLQLSETDLALLLKYLSRDKPLLVYSTSPLNSSELIIKLGSPPTPITDADVAIATLKSTLLSLELQIAPLETRITELEQSARFAVSARRSDAARSALRRKTLATTALERRRDDVHKLHEMLDAIDRARDQVAMVRAMEASAKVLRDLNAEVGGAEHVSNVADQLGEQIANVEEVNNVLNEPNIGVVDEVEVEDEFEQMVNEEREKDVRAREEEVRQTKERMAELEEWERRKKEEQETVVPNMMVGEGNIEQDVEERTKEMAEMHLV